MFLRCFSLFRCGTVANSTTFKPGLLSYITDNDTMSFDIIYNFLNSTESKESNETPNFLTLKFSGVEYDGCLGGASGATFPTFCITTTKGTEQESKESARSQENKTKIAQLAHAIVTTNEELKDNGLQVQITGEYLLPNMENLIRRYPKILPHEVESVRMEYLLAEIAGLLRTELNRLNSFLPRPQDAEQASLLPRRPRSSQRN